MAYCRADQSADVVTDSASSERVFSTAGRVLEKRRCQLSSSSVDALVFMPSQHHAAVNK